MSLFFLIIFILWICVGNLFYNSILNIKKINTKNIDILERDVYARYVRESQSCFQSLKKHSDMEEIYIMSKDHVKNHAYYFANSGQKWVLLVHDYLRDSTSLAILGKYYHDMGYHVLLVDLRCHGKSGGTFLSLGKWESLDVASFIAYILKKDASSSIILHGVSLGAVSIFLSLRFSFPKNVCAIVSDSAYTSVYDILYYHLHFRFGILSYPILFAINFVAKIRTGVTLWNISALKEISKNTLPTLFIHSKDDDFVPSIMSKALYLENPSFKELYFLEGDHGLSFLQSSTAYKKILSSFLSRYHL